MMLPTHALAGVVLALPLAVAAPEFAGPALLGGFLGGVLPDLDLYVGHRKTLHFPVYYSVGAAGTVPLAVASPTAATVVAATVLLGAAAHSVADVFGGGLELRPWEATSGRAVYDHHRGRWVAPRRWVRYDGAPEDLCLAALLTVPLLVAVDGVLRWVVVATLLVATGYSAVRKALPAVAARLVAALPAPALSYLPARYRNERGEFGDGRSV